MQPDKISFLCQRGIKPWSFYRFDTLLSNHMGMANVVKSYFLPPAWVYKPGGPIFLGSLISNPRQPHESLNPEDVNVSSNMPLTVDDEQSPFEAKLKSSGEHSIGIDASFLSIFGVGASIGVGSGKHTMFALKAECLTTQEINPDIPFLNAALSRPLATAFMAKMRFHHNVYCITGLMTGTNVSITSSEAKAKELHAGLSLGAAVTGVPVDIGPNWSTSSSQKTTGDSSRKSTIILGYRLRRITYIKKEKSASKSRDFRKGALLAERYDDSDPNDQSEHIAEAVQLDEDEVRADDFDFPAISAMDSNSTRTVVDLVAPVDT